MNPSSARASMVPSCSQAPIGQECCCCKRCEMGGCDLKVLDCGCCLHVRCCPVSENQLLTQCPVCFKSARALQLLPMAFMEIDQAQAEAAKTDLSDKRGKKRKNATIARLNPNAKDSIDTEEKGKTSAGQSTELRTGRWTPEETAYCDKLIELFEGGFLPVPNGTKLNDFLSSMLKSKQSRLTKKMKNARLSARAYNRTVGYILRDDDAKEFSRLETDFFASIRCRMERSEIRFHMQKEWREQFSDFCVKIGQTLDADRWLTSVEEMDRRASQAKDAARSAKRLVRMGYALSQDASNPQNGVFIEGNSSSSYEPHSNQASDLEASLPPIDNSESGRLSSNGNSSLGRKRQMTSPRAPLTKSSASPFITRVVNYLQRHRLPFEHVDAWVPSFVPGASAGEDIVGVNNSRLCFAGCATADTQVPEDGGPSASLTGEEQFDLVSFGEYSQKFSFDVGCGLPGRVYSSGVPSWEQGIHNAPSAQFERCGGAQQWTIRTVLGVPIPSPNVGRMVVLFYSRHDRPRNQETVRRITEELTRLMPSPKWKLVVEVGAPPKTAGVEQDGSENCQLSNELLSLICTHMPKDKTDNLAPYLPGFTSLHLLLIKRSKSVRENEMLKSVLASFSSYKLTGQSDSNVAWMTARDYMILSIQDAQHFASAPTNFSPKNNISAFQQQHQQPLPQLLHQVPPSLQANGIDCNGGVGHGSNRHSSAAESNSVAPCTTANHGHTLQSNAPMAEMSQMPRGLQGMGYPHNASLQPSIGPPETHTLSQAQNDAHFFSSLATNGYPGTHIQSIAQNDARFFSSSATEGFSGQLDMSFLSGTGMKRSGNQFSGSQHDDSINDFEAF